MALGLCRPSPRLVDLMFHEVRGLSQNGSASYLRHTLDTILGRKGLLGARLVDSIFPEVRWLSQNGSASYLRHTFDTVLGRMGLFGYRAEPAMNEGATYWTTASCSADWS